MSTISFDTHTFVKRLTQAGMPIAQAEVLADSQAQLIDDRLATKYDLNELEARLTRDIKKPESRLALTIKETETNLSHALNEFARQLTIRLVSIVVIAIGVVAMLVKLL